MWIQIMKMWFIDFLISRNLRLEMSEKLSQKSTYRLFFSFSRDEFSTLHLISKMSISTIRKRLIADRRPNVRENANFSKFLIRVVLARSKHWDTRIDLWQSNVHNDVVFWFFDVDSFYHIETEFDKRWIVHSLNQNYWWAKLSTFRR